jgi:transcriptional regulator with XRE-family HTH domain
MLTSLCVASVYVGQRLVSVTHVLAVPGYPDRTIFVGADLAVPLHADAIGSVKVGVSQVDAHMGRRVREIRMWRGVSLTAAAGLAGISASYLSLIERGQRQVNKRSTLESLAQALKVSPSELLGRPYERAGSASVAAYSAMVAVEDALTGWWLGEVPDVPDRPWRDVAKDVDRLNLALRPNADYTAQGELLPGLIRDLLSAAATDSVHRRDALIGLLGAYKAAAYLAHDLGSTGVPTLAVERMRRVAEELDDPIWTSYVAYQRAQVLSGANRSRQYELAVAAADAAPASRPEISGLSHLTAALASAAQGQGETAQTHLLEAASLAELIPADVSPWCQTNFGKTNVGIWRVSIGVELGYGAGVEEIAKKVRLSGVSRSRKAAFWIDFGRGLLSERKTRDRGLSALLCAEELAPEKIRTNAFVREAVTGLLSGSSRDSAGREVRGLAWRLGIAPTG